ncbi:MAG: hypothetical protein ACYC5M_01620 [Anaerolineae bacterium]
MSALIARLDMERAARPFFWVDYRSTPPTASHSYWDHCDIAGRYVDGLVLARALTGREDAVEEELALREYLWAQQDPVDGLFYNPEHEESSDAEVSKYIPDGTQATRPRHVDLFCQRAPLLALATLLAAGDESARPRLQQMVRGLIRISCREGDEVSFPTWRWSPTVKPEWHAGATAPEKWLGYRYALLTGLARYVELTGDPEAADLAMGLARWYMRHGDVPYDGCFAGNTHSGGILPATVGIARLGVWAGEREMVAWADRVYTWVRSQTPEFGFLVDGLGQEGFFASTCETCGLADLLHLAIVLSESGVGDYWDDIERYARNQLIENQYSDAAALREALPGVSDRVHAMLWGGYECAAHPNSLLTWNGAEGCCIGGGIRALYLVWRAAVQERGEETRVRMGLSRETPHVQVVGEEPWAGRITIRLASPRRLLVRVPDHAALDAVRVSADEASVPTRFEGRYLVLEGLRAGQEAVVGYPLRDETHGYHIGEQDYIGRWRGNTMMDIEPKGGRYPTYCRAHLLSEPNLGVAPGGYSLQDALPDLW